MMIFLSSFSQWQLHKILLFGACFLMVISSIFFHIIGIFPLDMGTFLFFSFVTMLFSLYRPAWAFLLFIGVLPLETITIAPLLLGGIMLRPYQWLAAILLVAVAIRFFAGRLPFRLFQWQWFDGLPVLIVFGAVTALVNAPVFWVALKQVFVVASFVAVYFLGRIFFRTLHDVRQALPFFLIASLIVLSYAFWQNIRALLGQESFQVMAGRPNATFAEADWLGMFVLLMLGSALVLLAHVLTPSFTGTMKRRLSLKSVLSIFFLASVFMVLLMTVARSAWLGAFGLAGVFLVGVLCMNKTGEMKATWKRVMPFGLFVFGSFLMAVALIIIFHLSPFQLLNRIQSTGGQQRITVSCLSGFDQALPNRVRTVADLPAICTHIRLEDIAQEKQAGHIVYEAYRDDPNIVARQEIYSTVWNVIKAHPILGIGWGSVALLLGSDERGAGLNASNVFLEVWLGSGLIGLIALVVFLGAVAWASWRWYRETENEQEQLFALFLFSTLFGMTVFDFFNSGILLGFFFIFLSLGTLALEATKVLMRVNE